MAYISKQEVQEKSKKLKEVCKKYSIKATFSGSNSSTLKCSIASGSIDFIENWITNLGCNNFNGRVDSNSIESLRFSQHLPCNHYYLDRDFSGKALECLEEIYTIMLEGHFDKSDIMTDFFHCSWYNRIEIGRWNKPYKVSL